MTTLTRDRNIEHWDAEDTAAWDAGGKQIAKRNLIWSIVAEHVGFSIWSIWSVMVLFMPQNVYGIDAAGKFYLVAVPTLVGAFMRIPYTIAPARFGGRNWTIVSALLLLIPTVLTLWAMKSPGTSYTTFMIVAAFAGFGGGNFASSMTNINAFYPQRLKGWALGLNAGGGNIGVPVIQLVGLLVIAAVGNTAPEIICAAYLVLIAVAALGAAFFMDNLRNQKSNFGALAEALRYRHSWVMSFLYIGTFGSFIGFSFAFGQVLQINFLSGGDTAAQAALHAAQISFLGPLLGSISRPFGGKLADRIGGGRITLYTFVAMIFAAGILVATGMLDDGMKGAVTGTQMTGYVVGFILLFILSGIGNGSTYKMIPSIFEAKAQDKDGWTAEQKATWSRTMSGALIGYAGAVGALGGVFINVALRLSYVGSAKSATNAFWVFLGFYVICAVATWLVFLRMQSVRAVTGEDGRPRARIGRRRLNDMTSTTRTACSYCGVGCGIEVQTRFDPASGAPVIARVSGDKLHPTNFGRLCTKGATHAEMMAADEDRLVTALVRHGRGEQATSTPVDDAVAEAGRRLRAIVDEHGPDSVALYVSGQMSIEAQYLATKLAKGFLRTKHIESNSRLCMASAGTGYKQSLGADGPPGSYTDFDITNLFFVIGSNMADCHPILYLRMVDRLKAGAKLVVVDPRRTATAEKADLFLQIKPGTDLALLNGLLHLLVESGDVDHDFIAEHTEGWGPMPEFLSDYPPEVVAGITGLAEADIRTAAAMIAEAGDWMTCWTMGLNQSTHGTWNTNAICNLHLATGAICRPGSGPMSLTGQPNAMGGREMGYMGPGLPGQRAVTSAEDRGFVERKWNLPPGTIRTDVGPGTIEMFKQMADGHIKACWVICTNPVATVANRKTVIAGLECTELVITQDAYRSTATNRYADVVLPATLWAESEAVMVNSDRNLTLLSQSIPPAGEARPDWLLICQVARHLGFGAHFAFQSSSEVFDEIREFSNLRTGYDLRGASYDRLRETPLQWPAPPVAQPGGADDRHPIRYVNDGVSQDLFVNADGYRPRLAFPTPSRRAVFHPRPHMDARELPDDDYPMVLNTGRLQHQWHTMTKTGKVDKLNKLNSGPFVEIHPGDAGSQGIIEGQHVELTSRRGRAVLPAVVTDRVRPGNCFVPFHWNDEHGEYLTINALTNDAVDPDSLQPEFKVCAVALRPIPVEKAPPAASAGQGGLGVEGLVPPTLDDAEKTYVAGFFAGIAKGAPGIPVLPPGAPVRPEVRSWIDGMLAGAYSRTSDAPEPATVGPLVLWASQTGNAEEFAGTVADQLAGARLVNMDDASLIDLAGAGDVVIVTSTFGDGGPPDNGAGFWSQLDSDAAPKLDGLRYAILGIGDRSYGDFCGHAKSLDRRLSDLGATKLVDRAECEIHDDEPMTQWAAKVTDLVGPRSSITPVPTRTVPRSDETFTRANPVRVPLCRNVALTPRTAAKEVRQFGFDVSENCLDYSVGDALGVFVTNDSTAVDAWLAATGLTGSQSVEVDGAEVALRDALTASYDICRVTPSLLNFVAERCTDRDASKVLRGSKTDRGAWLRDRNALDVVEEFAVRADAVEWQDALVRLTPRSYSISSSPLVSPNEVQVTVSVVRYRSVRGGARGGVSSTFLADRASHAPVFLQRSPHFRPPEDPSAPMIMVGPGTGIAPFRGFLQERRALGHHGRNWLFFGDQHRAENFYYRDDFEDMVSDGLLNRLDLAFSRDQPERVYVQHKVLDYGADVWRWLEEGAHFFVCGDATRMAKDVDDALTTVIREHGGMSSERAHDYKRELVAAKRYVRDVY